eukprot:3629779-Amphidinium_carterae.6
MQCLSAALRRAQLMREAVLVSQALAQQSKPSSKATQGPIGDKPANTQPSPVAPSDPPAVPVPPHAQQLSAPTAHSA